MDKYKYIGDIETGKVFEQQICVVDNFAKEHRFRRIRVQLISETRDGDSEIAIVSNIADKAASAKTIAGVHGADKIDDEVSGYYIADEISATYRGMMIALPENEN